MTGPTLTLMYWSWYVLYDVVIQLYTSELPLYVARSSELTGLLGH